MRSTLVAAGLVAVFASCASAQVASASPQAASQPAGAAPQVTYRGKVVDANGRPVSGAKVNCYVGAQ